MPREIWGFLGKKLHTGTALCRQRPSVLRARNTKRENRKDFTSASLGLSFRGLNGTRARARALPLRDTIRSSREDSAGRFARISTWPQRGMRDIGAQSTALTFLALSIVEKWQTFFDRAYHPLVAYSSPPSYPFPLLVSVPFCRTICTLHEVARSVKETRGVPGLFETSFLPSFLRRHKHFVLFHSHRSRVLGV